MRSKSSLLPTQDLFLTKHIYIGQDYCCSIGENQDSLSNIKSAFLALFSPVEWFNRGDKSLANVAWDLVALQRSFGEPDPRFSVCWYQLSRIRTTPTCVHHITGDRHTIPSIPLREYSGCHFYHLHISSGVDPYPSCL